MTFEIESVSDALERYLAARTEAPTSTHPRQPEGLWRAYQYLGPAVALNKQAQKHPDKARPGRGLLGRKTYQSLSALGCRIACVAPRELDLKAAVAQVSAEAGLPQQAVRLALEAPYANGRSSANTLTGSIGAFQQLRTLIGAWLGSVTGVALCALPNFRGPQRLDRGPLRQLLWVRSRITSSHSVANHECGGRFLPGRVLGAPGLNRRAPPHAPLGGLPRASQGSRQSLDHSAKRRAVVRFVPQRAAQGRQRVRELWAAARAASPGYRRLRPAAARSRGLV